jgi:UrcA family protein
MTTSVTPRVIGLKRGLLAGLLGSTLALSVQAGDIALTSDDESMTVSYAGLDLSDPAAMHTLYGRLKVAARIVCGGDTSGVREVQRIFAHRACVSDALESAVRSIDNAALTALHRSAESTAPVI